MCPPGFTSTDGFTDCKPCERDSFWINATHCENCPDGYRTTENGAPDIDGCKGWSVIVITKPWFLVLICIIFY